jgi:hypothetical protein
MNQISPWIPIAISVVSTVIMSLVGFIVKRETSRISADFADLKKANAEEAAIRRADIAAIASELKDRQASCEARFLPKEMFAALDGARQEVDRLRREADGRLERLIRELLAKHGG